MESVDQHIEAHTLEGFYWGKGVESNLHRFWGGEREKSVMGFAPVGGR